MVRAARLPVVALKVRMLELVARKDQSFAILSRSFQNFAVEEKNSNLSIQIKPIALNIGTLSKAFSSGDIITPKTLLERGLISSYHGRVPQVKILSNGEVNYPLVVSGCTISKEAKTKLEKAGGQVK